MIRQREQIKVHYVTPYDTNKNFGRAINEACDICKPGEWVCVRDGDTMFLLPEWGALIDEAIYKHGNDFDLIGCMTNRLNDTHQLHDGQLSDEMDIRVHFDIAYSRMHVYGTQVIPTEGDIAGMFMLIPYRTIKSFYFEENRIDFDREYCESLRSKGMRLGLMTGLYIFHLYRIWSSFPGKEIKHLLNYENRNIGNHKK
jgi:glycosyltransferase involved in cell wall biosynthesis